MSTINNIPFDINRTPTERNSSVKPTGTTPVYKADNIKPVDAKHKNTERRSQEQRRKLQTNVTINKRLLMQRRLAQNITDPDERPSSDQHTAGSIIDLEV
jgi:hypothetical protein